MEERFWSKVDITGDEHSCWNWVAARGGEGYGRFGVGHRTRLAHRISYEMVFGDIGAGMQIDHLCRNRACVNPWHLEPVTQQENIRRGQCGAHQRNKTYCPAGHAYAVSARLYPGRPSARVCRTCKTDHQRLYRAGKRVQ